MNGRKPIAVVCAMEWELSQALQALPPATADGDSVHLTQIGDQPLVLAGSGMGMQPAAARTHAVLERYAPRAVVNYGCAGAHRADLLPGDLVVATHVVAYEDDGRPLPVDATLLQAARDAAEALVDRHEPWPLELGWPTGLARRSPLVFFGTVASADRWNRAADTIAALADRHQSLCEDMEAAAIGRVCANHEVPFIAIKDISNNELLRPTASGQAMVDELGDQLARRAAAFTLALLQAAPQQ